MKTYTVEIGDDGSKVWYLDGKLHREDGPAVEYANGDKFWFRDGKCHREDGPACEWADGTKQWYRDGKRHREDGPAVEWADGTKEWYLDDNALTKAEFMARKKSCDGKVVTIDGKQYRLVEVK
jgi:hypothetical protein